MRFALLLLICFNLLANEKELYLFGGGGEPASKDKTIFDQDLINIINFSKKSAWKTTLAFNGGHAETEKILKSAPQSINNHGEFSVDNHKKMLQEIKDKLIQNKLKAGDQLMLVLDTHGIKQFENIEKTHTIALKKGFASVDDFQAIINLAEEKNVKIALVDLSCHSGSSLNLNHKKSCLISASGEKHMAFTSAKSFPINFTQKLKEQNNLEDIFLEARDEDQAAMEFPKISTTEGRIVQDLLYEQLTPFLFFNSKESDSNLLKKYYTEQPQLKICSTQNNFNAIENLLNNIEQIDSFSDSKSNLPYFQDLRIALKNYYEYQKEYAQALINQKKLAQKLIKMVSKNRRLKKSLEERNLTDNTILQIDYQKIAEDYEKELNQVKNEETKNSIQKKIIKSKENKKIIDELIAKLDATDQATIKDFQEKINETQKSLALAHAVSIQAKKLYTDQYNKIRKTESNPCRDFTL
ncbi:MAG: hypothetical protein U0T83_04340 [Bacteriovoracaceae bacterium]